MGTLQKIGIIFLALSCISCSDGFSISTLPQAGTTTEDSISLSIDESNWSSSAKRLNVSGICESRADFTYQLNWRLSQPAERQGSLPIACNDDAFDLNLDLASVNLPNGLYKLTSYVVAVSKAGDTYESDPDVVEFRISPPPVTNACSNAAVNAFCNSGAVIPDHSALVRELAQRYPAELSRCGRTNADEFIKIVIRELRLTNQRWGSNWVRGVIGDSNGDVISYYYGDGAPQENSPLNVIVDVVVACGGDNESVGWGVYSPDRNLCCNPDGSTKWTIAPLSR